MKSPPSYSLVVGATQPDGTAKLEPNSSQFHRLADLVADERSSCRSASHTEKDCVRLRSVTNREASPIMDKVNIWGSKQPPRKTQFAALVHPHDQTVPRPFVQHLPVNLGKSGILMPRRLAVRVGIARYTYESTSRCRPPMNCPGCGARHVLEICIPFHHDCRVGQSCSHHQTLQGQVDHLRNPISLCLPAVFVLSRRNERKN